MIADTRGAVLRGALVSSIDAGRAETFADGFVRIGSDGRIAEAGSWRSELDDGGAIDLAPALLLPAFVDAHVHLPQLDVRARYGEPLLGWLDRHVYPAEAAFADPALAEQVAERFCAALAAGGRGPAGGFAWYCLQVLKLPRTTS